MMQEILYVWREREGETMSRRQTPFNAVELTAVDSDKI